MKLFAFLIISLFLIPLEAQNLSVKGIDNMIEELELDKAGQLIERLKAENDEVSYLKGKLAFFRGNYIDANNYFSQLQTKDSVATCAINAYEMISRYRKLETPHFIIYYPDEKGEIYLEYLTEGLENGLKILAPIFGFEVKEKIRVEILSDQRDLSRLTTLPVEAIERTNTIAISKFNKIMLSSPETQLEGYDYVNTAVHEMIHHMISTVTQERTPVWIHEALARYFDHYKPDRLPTMRPDILALLKKRYENKSLITFEQIHPSMALLPSQEDTSVAFAEVFLVSEFLYNKYGPKFVKQILQMLKDKNDMDEIFKSFGFGSFERFQKEFFRYLARRTEKTAISEHLYYERTSKKGKKSEYLGDAFAMKYVKLGDLLFLENLFSAAYSEYDKASKIGVINPHIENRKAFALINAGRFSEASSILEHIVEIYPDYYSTFMNLARSYMGQKNFLKTLEALERAVRINPFDKEIYLMYLNIFQEQKNQYEIDKTKKKLEILNKKRDRFP